MRLPTMYLYRPLLYQPGHLLDKNARPVDCYIYRSFFDNKNKEMYKLYLLVSNFIEGFL